MIKVFIFLPDQDFIYCRFDGPGDCTGYAGNNKAQNDAEKNPGPVWFCKFKYLFRNDMIIF